MTKIKSFTSLLHLGASHDFFGTTNNSSGNNAGLFGNLFGGMFGPNSSSSNSGGGLGLFGSLFGGNKSSASGFDISSIFGSLLGGKNSGSSGANPMAGILNAFVGNKGEATQPSPGHGGLNVNNAIHGLFHSEKVDSSQKKLNTPGFFATFFNQKLSEQSQTEAQHAQYLSQMSHLVGKIYTSSNSDYANYLTKTSIELQSIPYKHEAHMNDIETMLGYNFDGLKAQILQGNMELAMFSHLTTHKEESKQFVKELYHYMGGQNEKTVASQLGDFMLLLNKVAQITQDVSLNEFLGTFDNICSELFEN